MANDCVIRYLPAAVDDIISIFDWIKNDSLANAATFVEWVCPPQSRPTRPKGGFPEGGSRRANIKDNTLPSRISAIYGGVLQKLDQRIGNLTTHPFLGRIPRDERLKSSGYRVLVIESCLAFYIVRGKTVEIHRVVHGSRNLDDII